MSRLAASLSRQAHASRAHRELTPGERAHALEMLVGKHRVMAIVRWIEKRLHLRKHHGEAIAVHKLGAHLLVDSRKVADVILGIHELLGVKRAARPVRKALGLGKVDAV